MYLTGLFALLGNLQKTCFCVSLKKNKNVRDAFASVTGRRQALPPRLGGGGGDGQTARRPDGGSADQADQDARAPSGSLHPAGYLHPAGVLHPVALIQWVCLILSHCHTLPARVQGAGV